MEDDLSSLHHEDDTLDRELNSLAREMEGTLATVG
jgi:hypothetical protein